MDMRNEKKYLEHLQSKKIDYPDSTFFDQLASNIIAENQAAVFKRPFYKRPIIQWIAAAAIVPMILFLALHKSQEPNQTVYVMLDKVPTETITAYVQEEHLHSASDELIFAHVNESNWTSTQVVDLLESMPVNEISDYLDAEYGEWVLEDME